MPTYVLLSNLTDEGAKALKSNPKRLQEVNKEIEKFGAKVTAQYAVLGPYDFVSIVECPDNETIARVSVALASRGNVWPISRSTSAISSHSSGEMSVRASPRAPARAVRPTRCTYTSASCGTS